MVSTNEALVPHEGVPAGEMTPQERLTYSKAQLDSALQIVTDWVLNTQNQLIEDEIAEVVSDTIRDHALRLRVMMVGLSKRRILNLMELARDIDRVEDHLRRVNLDRVPVGTIVRMYEALREREKVLTEYVAAIAEGGFPTKYESPRLREEVRRELEVVGAAEIAPTQREKVRTMVDRIRGALKERGVDVSE